jgi:hypothetical protein
MKKKQYRRAVSMKPHVYIALAQHCEAHAICRTSFVEALITQALEASGVSLPSRDEAIAEIRARAKPTGDDEDVDIAPAFFTF